MEQSHSCDKTERRTYIGSISKRSRRYNRESGKAREGEKKPEFAGFSLEKRAKSVLRISSGTPLLPGASVRPHETTIGHRPGVVLVPTFHVHDTLAQPTRDVHRGLDHRVPPRFVFDGTSREWRGGQLPRAVRARRLRLARLIEGRRAGNGAHLVTLEHHERGRYSGTRLAYLRTRTRVGAT
jgi:hypothetical protein